MATTPIKFLDLPAGLTATTKLVSLVDGSVLATVTLTESGEVYTGSVSASITGQVLFKVFVGTGLLGTRIRTIQDTTDTFIILTELEQLANNGRGAYPVVITVTDGTDPIEGALVRITKPGFEAAIYTNSDGIAPFALDNADYTITISATGYASEVDDLTVFGATTPADYELTADSIPAPTTPGTATGVMVVLDEEGAPEVGVPISIQFISGPGTNGFAYDTKARTIDSVTDGVVTIEGLIWGCTYRIWRGAVASSTAVFATRNTSTSATFVVPSLSSFTLPEIVGIDAE